MSASIYGPPDTPPADEPITIVECSQWVGLGGLTLAQAIEDDGLAWDAPRITTVRIGQSCPWGHSWYRENPETGKLELWRYNWDSSG